MSDEGELLDFHWIADELVRVGVYTLLAAYDAPPDDLPSDAVAMVGDALRLSAAVLDADPTTLPGQLLGRLVAWDEAWPDLPAQIREWREANWLEPLQPMLTPAGGAQRQSIQAHTEFVVAAVSRANESELLTCGNRDPVIRHWNLTDGRLLREFGPAAAGVNTLALLSDDTSLLAGDGAGVVRRWDVASGAIAYEAVLGKAAVLRLLAAEESGVAIASSEDGHLAILDLDGGAVVHDIAAHKTAIRHSYLVADAAQVVTIGDDRHVKLWSVETGEMLHDWDELEDRPTAVLLSDDHATLVVGDLTGTLLAWNLAAGEPLTPFAGHGSGVNALVWLGDTGQVASAGSDNVVGVWQLGEAEPVHWLEGHSGEAWRLAASSAGDRLASSAKSDEVIIWDTETGEALHTLPGHGRGAGPLQFINDDTLLLSADFDGLFRVWDTATGELARTLPGHSRAVSSFVVSDDGDTLMSAGQDGAIKLWRLSNPVEPLPRHSDDPRTLLPLPAEQTLASTGMSPELLLWDSQSGALRHRIAAHDGNITLLQAGTVNQPVLTAGFDGAVRAWDPVSGEMLLEMNGHDGPVRAMLLVADGRLVSGGDDTEIHLWDLTTGEMAATLTGHEKAVLRLAQVDGAGDLLSMSNDGQLLLWSLADHTLVAGEMGAVRASGGFQLDRAGAVALGIDLNGQPHRWLLDEPDPGVALAGHSGNLSKVALGADGQTVASAAGAELIVWDVAPGTARHTLTGHAAPVDALLLDSERRRLVSAAHDGAVHIWDTASGEQLAAHTLHTNWITQLLPTGDGRALTADGDGLIGLWDIASGTQLASLTGHNGSVVRLLPLAAAELLVSAGSDNSVRVWSLGDGRQMARFQLDARPVSLTDATPGEVIAVSDTGGAVHFLRVRSI